MFFKFFKNNLYLIAILLIASFFRLYQLSSVPASLFGDEVDVGYQAYSILKTGRDYSGNFMPLHFHSLAEWRTPLYLYSAVPTVAIFGISPLGVRLPAVIFGILSIWGFYLLFRILTNNEKLAIIGSFLLSVNPWHLQYSRAGFEVTMLLTFLIFGLYFFFKDLKSGKYLGLSLLLLLLTPLIYSTAKLFTPALLLFLLIVYRKEIFNFPKKNLILSIVIGLLVGGLTTYAVLFSGGSQRFNYISVFSDPITEPEIGVLRLNDAKARGETGTGLRPTIIDRAVHNKFVFWGERISSNYLQSLGTDFLFINGDPNPRHMMDNMGMFFKIDALFLIFGTILFFISKDQSIKNKTLIIFWILAGIMPAAITRDGGNHATRLMLILPPLLFLISYGVMEILKKSKLIFLVIFGVLILSFGYYLHMYYVHYPFNSERWWHSGWKESISEIKKIDSSYEKVIITMKDEPAWIFFAGWYEYDPVLWHKEFPIGNDVTLNGFGKISHTGKFYFGSPTDGIYSLGSSIDTKTLYLASSKEIPWNLILEPSLKPAGIKLIKSIAYPSGEPAFYLFTKE